MHIDLGEDAPPANVTPLPVKPRDNNTERVLTKVPGVKCWHRRFLIDEKLAQVECHDCGDRLDPMYALTQLCHQENRYHELHDRYHDELKRLGERSKTKCQHCGQMTKISRA